MRDAFGPAGTRDPSALVGDLENALGHGKHAWPLAAIRRMADVLIELATGRGRRRRTRRGGSTSSGSARVPASARRPTTGACRSCGPCTRPGWRIRRTSSARSSGSSVAARSGRVHGRAAARAGAAGHRAARDRAEEARAHEPADRTGGMAPAGEPRAARCRAEDEARRRADPADPPRAPQRRAALDARPSRCARAALRAAQHRRAARGGRALDGAADRVESHRVGRGAASSRLGPRPATRRATCLPTSGSARLPDRGRGHPARGAGAPARDRPPRSRAAATRVFGESLPQGLRIA
jgi:hypothetical protein